MTTASNTTGIGSLPHHNVDSALEFAFRMGIPFLPQIPIRNPWEYMIAQALEGLPGLEADREGKVVLNVPVWESRTALFRAQLEEAFAQAAQADAFERFEPHAAVSSSWQAFLFELEERGLKRAKAQIAGPMTAQWTLRLKDQSSASQMPATLDALPELTSQIYRLVLARAIAAIRRMKSIGVKPLFFLDEPGLYGLSLENARHVLGFSELKLMIQALAREGADVGLHCCSNTDWNLILELGASGLSVLSLDTQLSLPNLLGHGRAQAVARFIEGGGRLALGVIPTSRSSALRSLRVEDLFAEVLNTFTLAWPEQPELTRLALQNAIYTPACGLAFLSVDDAELVLDALGEFEHIVRHAVPARPRAPKVEE